MYLIYRQEMEIIIKPMPVVSINEDRNIPV